MDRARDWVRRNTSMGTRRKVAMTRVQARRIASPFRALPGALIIGTQRGGTSSLYRYLGAHPDVTPSLRKETEYFSTEFHRGEAWYRAHFPLHGLGRDSAAGLTFEATPDYLLHPLAASRASALVPQAKIVVMLRNPVERTFSQYKHNRRLGIEQLPFEDAIAAEPSRISSEFERIQEDPLYQALPLRRFGYIERGKYAEQLERWTLRFLRVCVLNSDDFIADPRPVFETLLEFLELAPWAPPSFQNYSYTAGSPAVDTGMSPEIREHLSQQFVESNGRLEALTGRSFAWAE